tara:strand:+ start:119 stop:613 length:495 start_codon:yes stop_codon:yes gene_type:complete
MILQELKTKPFFDFRGKYVESFNLKKVKKKFKINFVQDDFSYSKKNVLRGFHGDNFTWKLFTCVYGKIQIAVINFDENSKNYKKNKSIILSEDNNTQILVPPKHGVAHLILSDRAILHYKQSTYYKDHEQFTISHNSPCLNFKWKSKKFIVSKRDKGDKAIILT